MWQSSRWVLVIAAILCCAPRSAAQGFRFDSSIDGKGDGGYSAKWDSVQDRLILYRDASARALPAARVFGKDGESVPIYPLRDLDESQYIDIWSAAATPEGGIVLDAVVGYSARNNATPASVRSVLLTYDGAGDLARVWDVKPYHHYLVAVDGDANVFALGDRDDVNGPYPLVVKYSPSGRVMREFLSSSLFSEGDDVTSSASPNGESQMFIRGDQLFLWVAPSQELLCFSLAGELLSRTSLARALGEVATATGGGRTRVLSLTATNRGEILAQVSLWPKAKSERVKFSMIRVSADGTHATLAGPVADTPTPGRFLGATPKGKLLFLELQGKQANVGVVREY